MEHYGGSKRYDLSLLWKSNQYVQRCTSIVWDVDDIYQEEIVLKF